MIGCLYANSEEDMFTVAAYRWPGVFWFVGRGGGAPLGWAVVKRMESWSGLESCQLAGVWRTHGVPCGWRPRVLLILSIAVGQCRCMC